MTDRYPYKCRACEKKFHLCGSCGADDDEYEAKDCGLCIACFRESGANVLFWEAQGLRHKWEDLVKAFTDKKSAQFSAENKGDKNGS